MSMSKPTVGDRVRLTASDDDNCGLYGRILRVVDSRPRPLDLLIRLEVPSRDIWRDETEIEVVRSVEAREAAFN